MIVLAILSFLGLIISLYFTLVEKNLIKPDAKLVPSFCRMDGATCMSILNTREARVLGIPNFHLGVFYYLGFILFSFFPEMGREYLAFARLAAGIAVAIGIFLSFSLLFRIKKNCVLCFSVHALNLVIFLYLFL